MVLVHSAFTHSQAEKQNRENRIKNACFSNSHSNIAASNDKRPLFVQISATPSTSLVSTSLPIQCLRPTNFFFCRGIFADIFLFFLFRPPPQRILIGSERIPTTSLTYSNRFGTYSNHLGTYCNRFGTWCRHSFTVAPPSSKAGGRLTK